MNLSMTTTIFIVSTSLVVSSPAFALFFVVHDNTTKQCSITEQRPKNSNVRIVGGDNKIYANRADAEKDMQTSPVCRPSKFDTPFPTPPLRPSH